MGNFSHLFSPQDNFDPPSGGRVWHFALGAVLPIAITWFALNCIARVSTPFPHRRGIEHLSGVSAISLAVAYLALGAFLHFHFLWGSIRRLSVYSQLGRSLSFVVFVVGIIAAFVFYFAHW